MTDEHAERIAKALEKIQGSLSWGNLWLFLIATYLSPGCWKHLQ